MTAAKTFIVVPTYNEASNITAFLSALLTVADVQVLVVDDNSPDGTSNQVEELRQDQSRIHLLKRPSKEGLGKAYVSGFKKAIELGAQRLVQMDADFSHRVEDLKVLLQQPEDCVFGSRWVHGGKIVNWSLWRVVLSRVGNIHAQIFLGARLSDWTGGFNCWNAHVFREIDMLSLEAQGYVFQIELKHKALRQKCWSYKEVPITFEERRAGLSKMSWRIVFEAFWRVITLSFEKPGRQALKKDKARTNPR